MNMRESRAGILKLGGLVWAAVAVLEFENWVGGSGAKNRYVPFLIGNSEE